MQFLNFNRLNYFSSCYLLVQNKSHNCLRKKEKTTVIVVLALSILAGLCYLIKDHLLIRFKPKKTAENSVKNTPTPLVISPTVLKDTPKNSELMLEFPKQEIIDSQNLNDIPNTQISDLKVD